MVKSGLADRDEEVRPGRTMMADVYALLRRDIIECRLRPGARLRFEEMRQSYDIGLTPLREALMRLASDGLVVLQEHRGFHVAPISRANLLDVVAMREELDSIGLRFSITNGDEDWEGRVLYTLNSLRKCGKFEPDGRVSLAWEVRHRAFHTALVSAADSPWLLRFRDLLYDQLARYKQYSEHYLGRPRDDYSEHKAIADAALERDGELADRLLRRHIEITKEALLVGSPEWLPGGKL